MRNHLRKNREEMCSMLCCFQLLLYLLFCHREVFDGRLIGLLQPTEMLKRLKSLGGCSLKDSGIITDSTVYVYICK